MKGSDMMDKKKLITRRKFIDSSSKAIAGAAVLYPSIKIAGQDTTKPKIRLAMVGTGGRGLGMWGQSLLEEYSDYVEFVGLCDINPGRLNFAKEYLGVDAKVYTDFEKMVRETKPEAIIVTTVDATHDEFIVKGLEMGCNIITEKPMTTDETKCQNILDAERKSKKNVIVTFNYRYSPHRQKIKELLMQERIGKVTSVDFHWYLDIYHGAAYFRRWHRLKEKGGTLLVHKATHHFDLLNWWLDSDPQQVFGYGNLEHYGRNHSFRSTNCRPCPHKDKCKFFWDITKKKRHMDLYVAHEKYDGYLRDGCVWKEDINIYDKMAVQIKYANDVQVSYSLTTYSPYEGYRIAFNGMKGRLEAWVHERQPWDMEDFDQIRVTDNFGETELINIPHGGGGHGGGDTRLKDKIFKNPAMADPYAQAAGTRDGAMSVLIGVGARNSIESGKPVNIEDLTDLEPQGKRPSS
jgi:predicted dehydrogenase